jgi:hypothetical protein
MQALKFASLPGASCLTLLTLDIGNICHFLGWWGFPEVMGLLTGQKPWLSGSHDVDDAARAGFVLDGTIEVNSHIPVLPVQILQSYSMILFYIP